MPASDCDNACAIEFLLASPVEHQDVLIRNHTAAFQTLAEAYLRLGTWYARRGLIRPHAPVFTAIAAAADDQRSRTAGMAMLQHLSIEEIAEVLRLLRRVSGKIPRCFRTAVAQSLPPLREAARDGRFTQRRVLNRLTAALHLRPAAGCRPDRQQPLPALTVESLTTLTPGQVHAWLDDLTTRGAMAVSHLRRVLIRTWWQHFQDRNADRLAAAGPRIERRTAVFADDPAVTAALDATLRPRLEPGAVLIRGEGSPAGSLDALRRSRTPVDQIAIASADPQALQRLLPAFRAYRNHLGLAPEILLLFTRPNAVFATTGLTAMPWTARRWQPDQGVTDLRPLFLPNRENFANQLFQ